MTKLRIYSDDQFTEESLAGELEQENGRELEVRINPNSSSGQQLAKAMEELRARPSLNHRWEEKADGGIYMKQREVTSSEPQYISAVSDALRLEYGLYNQFVFPYPEDDGMDGQSFP